MPATTLKTIIAEGKERYASDPDAASWTEEDWKSWARVEKKKLTQAPVEHAPEVIVPPEVNSTSAAETAPASMWERVVRETDDDEAKKASARNLIIDKPLKKHEGKTLGFVLDTDCPYLDWAISIVRDARHRTLQPICIFTRVARVRAGTAPWQAGIGGRPSRPGHHLSTVAQDGG